MRLRTSGNHLALLGLLTAGLAFVAPKVSWATGRISNDDGGSVLTFDRAALVTDSSMQMRQVKSACICPEPSRRNILGLLRPTPHAPGKMAAGTSQTTLRVLGIRIDFPFEEIDDPLTTGRGRFDLRDTTAFFDSAGHNFDSSPHNRRYFETHLRALDQYWGVVSNERLNLEWHVYPVAEDSAYRVPEPTGFYGRERDGDSGLVFGLRQFIVDAAEAASADPAVRFGDYDAVIIFHAGTSRQFDILSDSPNDLFSVFIRRDEPVILRDGADTLAEAIIMPETVSQDGRIGVINGVLAHEFGHQLGLVDLYSTFNFTTQVGNFSLMDNNANDIGIETEVAGHTRILFGALPVFPDAWSRAYLGFTDVTTVTDSDGVILWVAEKPEVPGINISTWRVPISSTEYYLLENRMFDLDGNQQSGLRLDSVTNVVLGPADPATRELTSEYDFLLPGSGMLIWHVDEGVAELDYVPGDDFENNFLANSLQWDRERRFLKLEEADGYQQLGSLGIFFFWTGDERDYWSFANNPNFTPRSIPPTVSNTGAPTGISISQISFPGTQMTCNVSSAGKIDGFPVYLGAQSGNAGAPVIADVTWSGTDYRTPGDDRPEVFVGYKHYILAYDADGNPLTDYPGLVLDSTRNYDSTWIVRELRPAAAGIPGEEWIGPPLVYTIDGQTAEIAAVSKQGSVFVWYMFDSDLDGLFDHVAGEPIRTTPLPSGPPAIWNRPGNPTPVVKDLFVPLENSTYIHYSMLNLTLQQHELPSNATGAAGLSRDDVLLTMTDGSSWFVGHPTTTVPPIPVGNDSLFSPAAGDIDRDGTLDYAVLSIAGDLTLYGPSLAMFDGFPQALDLRPDADPILADVDRDGYLDIVVSGEGRLTAIARNGVMLSDFPVTIGRASQPDSATSAPLAIDLGGGHLSLVTGGSGGATLAYRDGREVQEVNRAVGGSIIAPSAWAYNAQSNSSILYARSSDGFLYAFPAPDQALDPAKAIWPFGGHDARNTRTVPPSDLEPIPANDNFFIAERAYIYPNPAKGEATLRYWLGDDADVSITIYDIAGNVVREADGPGTGGAYNEWTWPCADVASGVYYARLEVTSQVNGSSETVFCKMAVVQ